VKVLWFGVLPGDPPSRAIRRRARYGDGISALARNHIHHISKETFLPAFKAAYEHIFTEANARAGFRGAGLIPFNPDAVLSKLNVRLRTPTPPQRDNTV
jgi:hypothetical protein